MSWGKWVLVKNNFYSKVLKRGLLLISMVKLFDDYVPAKDVPLTVKIGYRAVVEMCEKGEIEGAQKVGRGWAITRNDIKLLISMYGRYVRPERVKADKPNISLEEVSRFTGISVGALRQYCKYGMIEAIEGEGDNDWRIRNPRGLVQAMEHRTQWYKDNYPKGIGKIGKNSRSG